MDFREAARMVFSRIKTLNPEDGGLIMGYLLLQDVGEKEMIRLALGPDTVLQNLIVKTRTQLGISSSTVSTPSTPSSPSPFISISRPSPLSLSSSRISSSGFDITNPCSPSSNNPFSLSGFADLRSPTNPMSPSSNSGVSYANIVNGTSNGSGSGSLSSNMSPLSSAFPFFSYNGGNSNDGNNGNDFIDDYQLQDRLSFLNDSKTDDLFNPRLELAVSPSAYGGGDGPTVHRRSFSVPGGVCFGSEDASSGFGWKPCLYFARGFCKNGSSCRFLHGGDSTDNAAIVGSPSQLNEFEHCHELLRSKAAQQQKLAAAASQFVTGVFPYSKNVNFLLQQQNDSPRSAAAAALMMGDELHKYGRCRLERNDFSGMGFGGAVNPGSRQIYLTFPADSTFREEDVSNYFSMYGPVQDVRIPYQQKRMFGFVTFVYAETVKLILAKGNPHFVCDSRVLVKPYKEKGKVSEKKQQHQQQQQLERGEYSACSSPSGLDSREPFDLHIGPRMFYNSQEMLRRKLEEQADLQQALELQSRRLMNLQLLDLKNNRHNHHHHYHHGLSAGSPILSPTLSQPPNNQTIFSLDGIDQEVTEENSGSPNAAVALSAVADADHQLQEEGNSACNHNNDNDINSSDSKEKANSEENDLHESLEHILPDNLFASPRKSAGEHSSAFSSASAVADDNTTSSATSSSNSNPLLPPTSALNMASLKSCFLQMPRFPSGHGTIGM